MRRKGFVAISGLAGLVLLAAPTPPASAKEVSCTATNACMAVGPGHLAEIWNGRTWMVLASAKPPGSTVSHLSGVSCTAANSCMAVGYEYAPHKQALAEKWNGRTWTVLRSAVPLGSTFSYLTGVSCTAANACMAVGYDYTPYLQPVAERWNGRRWKVLAFSTPPLSSPLTVKLPAVSCAAANACMAVGTDAAPLVQALAETWDGSSWTALDSSNPPTSHFSYLSGVSCTAANACMAVGHYYDYTPDPTYEHNLAETWDGSGWTVLGSSNPPTSYLSYLSGVSCTAANVCMAVGHDYTPTPPDYEHNLAETWDGSGWTVLGGSNPPASYLSYLNGVSCIAANFCMAVGLDYQHTPPNYKHPLAEIWNGSSWTVTPWKRTGAAPAARPAGSRVDGHLASGERAR